MNTLHKYRYVLLMTIAVFIVIAGVFVCVVRNEQKKTKTYNSQLHQVPTKPNVGSFVGRTVVGISYFETGHLGGDFLMLKFNDGSAIKAYVQTRNIKIYEPINNQTND